MNIPEKEQSRQNRMNKLISSFFFHNSSLNCSDLGQAIKLQKKFQSLKNENVNKVLYFCQKLEIFNFFTIEQKAEVPIFLYFTGQPGTVNKKKIITT